MAKEKGAPAQGKSKNLQPVPVEELFKCFSVPVWMQAGMMAAYGWGQGKQLTEDEFVKAKSKWLSGPMKGGK